MCVSTVFNGWWVYRVKTQCFSSVSSCLSARLYQPQILSSSSIKLSLFIVDPFYSPQRFIQRTKPFVRFVYNEKPLSLQFISPNPSVCFHLGCREDWNPPTPNWIKYTLNESQLIDKCNYKYKPFYQNNSSLWVEFIEKKTQCRISCVIVGRLNRMCTASEVFATANVNVQYEVWRHLPWLSKSIKVWLDSFEIILTRGVLYPNELCFERTWWAPGELTRPVS